MRMGWIVAVMAGVLGLAPLAAGAGTVEFRIDEAAVIGLDQIDSVEIRTYEVPEYVQEAMQAAGSGRVGEQTALIFKLTDEGRRMLKAATADNVGKQIAIYIDGELMASPRIQDVLDTDEVVGQLPLSAEEQADIARRINAAKARKK